jgi:tetratricopeptide (TPR) repeat protein
LAYFVIVTGALAVTTAFQATRTAVSDSLVNSAEVRNIVEAVKLDGKNSEYEYRLGLAYGWQSLDPQLAVIHLKHAIYLNPHKAEYWHALGWACYNVGNQACSDEAFANTLRLAPQAPHYRWEAGNYYLETDQPQKSLIQFQRFLQLQPEDPRPVFELCRRASYSSESLWSMLSQSGNPARLRLAYISFLTEKGDSELADRFWNELVSERPHFPFAAAGPFVEQLLNTHQFQRSTKVWQDLQTLGVIPHPPAQDSSNLVFNGNFERTPLNAGFDWRYQPQEYLTSDFADTSCYRSTHCLSIDFTVPSNADYEPVYEIVPVLPDRHYVLTAEARSLDITSDSGPRLRVIDPDCQSCITAETGNTVATTPWHELSTSFATRAHTQAVRISVWRPRSRAFPMNIEGRFWLDGVSLREIKEADVPSLAARSEQPQ